MPKADKEQLDEQWARFQANREHSDAVSEKRGWLQAAEFIRDEAGRLFVRHEEDEARGLRALANRLTNEANIRFDERIRKLLKEAAAAEREHVAALESEE